MKYSEQVNLVWMSILLGVILELIVFGGLGFAVPIAVGVYYVYVIWRLRQIGKEWVVLKDGLLWMIVLTSLCFAVFDNDTLKFFNVLLLAGLLVLHGSVVFGTNDYEAYTPMWFFKVIPMTLVMPFEKMGEAVSKVTSEIKETQDRHRKLKHMKSILIGCVIGIPLMFIAMCFLMVADPAFEGVIDLIWSQFDFELEWLILRMILFALCFFPFIGFIEGLTHGKKQREVIEGEEVARCYVPAESWKLDFVVALTVGTLVGIVYLLYLLAQLTYFISAFQGILPEGFTYAEYARRGFFEMLPVAGINLGIIFVLQVLTAGKESKAKAKWLKGYTVYYLGFTLFIMVTALSKMMMYMGIYGLTLKRVLVSWILLFGVISFVLVGIKVYGQSFKLTKYLFFTFIVMYIGLNYANVDYWIGKYNAKLYTEQGVGTLESFYDLSLSGVEGYLELEVPEATDDYTHQWIKWRIEQERGWLGENVARCLAKQKWRTHYEE